MKLILLSALSIIFLGGCDFSHQYNYYPLDEGMYWQYRLGYTTMDGTFKSIYAVENLAPETIGGETYYVRRLIDGSNNYIKPDKEGILLAASEKNLDFKTTFSEKNNYLFKFPLKVGTQWEAVVPSKVLIKTGPPQKTEFHIVAKIPVLVRIESMTDTVTVPAGRFENCMRVNLSGDAFTNAGNYVGLTVVKINETNWYAPGIGLIKSVRKESTKSRALNKGELTLELLKFRE